MSHQEDGSAFSDEEMLEFLRNLMIAGRDTTAVTLTWCAS
jgi:cytochrome P450